MSQRDSKKEGGGRKGVFFWTGPKTDFEVFFARKNIFEHCWGYFSKIGFKVSPKKDKSLSRNRIVRNT